MDYRQYDFTIEGVRIYNSRNFKWTIDSAIALFV